MQGLHEFNRGVNEFNRGVNELNTGVNDLNRGVNRSVAKQGCNLLRAAVTSQGCCCGNLQIHPLDLGQRKTIAPGVAPISINKSEKTDKIVKPKNNPYLKRNTLRIQEASKTGTHLPPIGKFVPNVGTIITSLHVNSSGILRH